MYLEVLLKDQEVTIVGQSVRVIEFDIGSPTDTTSKGMQARLHASSIVETMRRSLEIADAITDAKRGRKSFVRDADGTMRRIVFS